MYFCDCGLHDCFSFLIVGDHNNQHGRLSLVIEVGHNGPHLLSLFFLFLLFRSGLQLRTIFQMCCTQEVKELSYRELPSQHY